MYFLRRKNMAPQSMSGNAGHETLGVLGLDLMPPAAQPENWAMHARPSTSGPLNCQASNIIHPNLVVTD